MSKLVLYIDGSEIRIGDHWKQGWGILASHHKGETVEINGSLQCKRNGRNGGWHETLAFYHAVLYAESQGYICPMNAVSNNRVDYLARSAIYNKATHECMDFESWLENGFSVWDNEIKANKIHLMPFVKADHGFNTTV